MISTEAKIKLSIATGLVGFVTGIVSLCLQLAPLIRQAKIMTLPPTQVLFILHQNPGSEVEMIRFATVQSHVNIRSVGQAAILMRETASLVINEDVYRYTWQSFEHFQPKPGGNELISTESKGAYPVVIAPGDVESHETYFAPNSGPTRFTRWADFLSKVEESSRVEIQLVSDFYSSHPTTTTCVVQFTKERLARLKERGWEAPTCRERSPPDSR